MKDKSFNAHINMICKIVFPHKEVTLSFNGTSKVAIVFDRNPSTCWQ